MDTSKNYYEILQVSPNADQGVIEAAYRRFARESHPDASSQTGSAERMKEINEAFEVLGDPTTRRQYDQARALGGANVVPSEDARRNGIPGYVWFAGLGIGIVGVIAALLVLLPGGDGSGSGIDAGEISCDSFENVESYRFSLDLKLDAPAFQDLGTPSPLNPLSAFSDALTSLFSNMKLQGAFSAPDRSQVILDFRGEELEWRMIGDRTWVRLGDEWEAQPSDSDNDLLTPEVVCNDVVLGIAASLEDASFEADTVNGIETYYYAIDVADIKELPALLLGPGATDLPDDLTFDLWLAQEGLWPVKINFAARDTNASGQSVELTLDMEVRDVNDPGILIEPPIADNAD